MADLDAEDREKIPTEDFGLPEKARTKEAKKESGNYPMPDKGHARNAKARAAQQQKAGSVFITDSVARSGSPGARTNRWLRSLSPSRFDNGRSTGRPRAEQRSAGQLIGTGNEVEFDVHCLARVQNVGGKDDLTAFASDDQRVGKFAFVEDGKVDLPAVMTAAAGSM